MASPPKFGTAIDTSFLKSMAKTNNGVVMIVDLKKIFSAQELENVKELEQIQNT